MSALTNKSGINEASAELLHKNNLYSSVCHCAYYSSVQLMRHIWFNKMNKTETELYTLTRASTENSHGILINQIVNHIKGKSMDARNFNTEILSLKKLRTIADYNDETIDFSHSTKSLALSKSVNLILNKCV